MSVIPYVVNSFLNDPSYHAPLATIKGLRQGIVYGAKVRFAHALVQAVLFRNEPWSQRLRLILRMTYLHSKTIGISVFLYKTLRTIFGSVFGLSKQWRTLICGFIVGLTVFQKHNSVNEQIILYLLARVVVGLARYAQKRSWLPTPKRPVFPWCAAVIWTLALWLFEFHREALQPSMTRSLVYLYEDSDRWSTWRNFLLRDSSRP